VSHRPTGLARSPSSPSGEAAAAPTATGSAPRASARDAGLDLDPLAGEDEPWADEDFLWIPDEEDHAGFFRTFWIALVLCVLVWLAVALVGAKLFGLAATELGAEAQLRTPNSAATT
jgi:hypothetical protein